MTTIAASRAATIAAALASIGTDEQLKAAGITNGRAASYRTASIDLPNGKYSILGSEGEAKVNRVKITAHGNGTVSVRLVEVPTASGIVPMGGANEHECIDELPPAAVGPLLTSKISLTV